MADGPYGKREIFIDLHTSGARVIRAASAGETRGDSTVSSGAEWTKVTAVRIKGTSAGDVVLREESASGPIFFKLGVTTGAVDGTQYFNEPGGGRVVKGVYMDSPGAWASGDFMIIYTA